MRKQIPLIKKAGAFALLLGLMFTLVSPYAIYAEEEGTVTPQTEETNTQEQVEENNTLETPSTRSFDVNKPDIEKVYFDAVGKTFNVGEEVPISVSAYDAESGIDFVNVYVYYSQSDDEDNNDYEEINLIYNSTTNLYEGKILAKNGGYDKAIISRIYAVDKCQNFSNIVGNDKYYFLISGGENNNLKNSTIESLGFKENGKSISIDDQVHFTLTVPEKDSKYFTTVNLQFYNEDKDMYNTITCYNNGISNVYKYEGLLYDFSSGKWTLESISSYESHLIEFNYADDMKNIYFNFEGNKDEESPKIESIVIDQQGQFVEPGNEVQIHVKASDNEGLKSYYKDIVVFHTDAAINDPTHYVDLNYDEEKEEYLGIWIIDENTYPCEWYLDDIYLQDLSGNYVDTSSLIGNNRPYYFRVKNEDKFVNQTYTLNINFYVINEYGDYNNVSSIKKEKVERRTKLKDIDIEYPDATTSYEGLKFEKWVGYDGNVYTDDIEIVGNNYIDLFATYDKNIIEYNKTYVNKNKNVVTEYDRAVVSKDITYQEFINKYISNVEDLYDKEEFEKCEYNGFDIDTNLNDVIPFQPWNYIHASAKFKDLKVIQGSYFYIDEYGDQIWTSDMNFVKETLLRSEAYELLADYKLNSYEGLRFVKWTPTGEGADNTINRAVSNYEEFEYDAEYENYLVRFMIYDRNKPISSTGPGGGTTGFDIGINYIIVAEDGEEIRVPKFENMKDIEWYEGPESDIIMVTSNLYYYGIGTGIEEEIPDVPNEPDTPVTPDQPDEPDTPVTPDKPDEPDTPVEPDKPVTPVEPEKPITPDKPSEPDKEITDTGTSGSTTDKVIVLPKEETNKIVEEITKADKEEKIEVFMGNATVVPTEVLEAAKGKDVVVELNMGGYTWEINGKDILASNLKDINLEVKMDSHAVPSNIVKELAGDNPVKQLSLTHNGNFGFKANLKINVGNEYKGKYGNLYYYDSDGKMVYMNAGKIDENGNVVVSFSHASDYVIVINDKNMAPSTNDKDVIKDTANHVNNLYGFVSISLCIFGALMLLYANKKKS